MTDNSFFQQGARGCLLSLVLVLVSLVAMTLSVSVQYPEHRSCGGMMGAGFPVLFICDDWGGGSPTNSWGKITLIDIPNGGIRPTGFLIDLLFYLGLAWIACFAAAGLLQRWIRLRDLGWAALISLGFLSGFVCAALTFYSSSLYLGDYYHYASPTPIVPSPTSFGTMPFPVTSVPTPGP